MRFTLNLFFFLHRILKSVLYFSKSELKSKSVVTHSAYARFPALGALCVFLIQVWIGCIGFFALCPDWSDAISLFRKSTTLFKTMYFKLLL